ncbi:MAG TPA: GNAT family N-acetyltransferase [Thermoleophilaceae bacterium]|nr:GNAT family N-acetyltransferase [Thermoleophilaceae bacterium]
MAHPLHDGRRAHDPGALLATTHRIPGGGSVRLRLARPSDAPRVSAFLSDLSPETAHRRFGSSTSERLVRHFTFYDPRRRLIVAATMPVDGRERIVGLADVAVLDTGLAEIGLVVSDGEQRLGIGTVLADAVAALAARRGATHVKAEMVERNAGMIRVMERLGRTVHTVENGHAVAYTRIAPASARAA